MNQSNNTASAPFVRAVSEIRALEAELDSQLRALEEVSDRRMALYASVLRRTARIAAGCGSAVAAVRWNLAGAFAAKAVIAASKAAAARRHNAGLDKLLKSKRAIAAAKLPALQALRGRIDANGVATERLARQYGAVSIATGRAAAETPAALQALECRRSSMHLAAVADFLEAEYSAWLDGRQRGRRIYPLPVHTLRRLAAQTYGNDLRGAFVAAATEGVRSGADLMLLADPALALLALHGGDDRAQLFTLDLGACEPEAAAVISANPALTDYRSRVAEYTAASRRNPVVAWDIVAALISAAALTAVWLPESFALPAKIIGTVAYLAGGARIWLTTRRRIIRAHVDCVRALAAGVADYVRDLCGEFAMPQPDLERRHPGAEALKSFLES